MFILKILEWAAESKQKGELRQSLTYLDYNKKQNIIILLINQI